MLLIPGIHTAITAAGIGAQPVNANLTGLAAITPTKGNIPVGNGTTFVSSPAIGADGTQLTAADAQATGVTWGAAS